MDNDQADPSRPKRACVLKFPNEREIELLLDSDNDANFDLEYSGSEYIMDYNSDLESENEEINILKPNINDTVADDINQSPIVWRDIDTDIQNFTQKKAYLYLNPVRFG